MNKMFNFNGMPYKRSGRAGGKSVSMIGMLVLLLAALLVLPSCTGDDTETVTQCHDGTTVPDGQTCPEPPDPVDPVTCGDGTVLSDGMCVPDPAEEYDMVGELEEGECYMDGDAPGMVMGTDADECINGEGGDDIIKGEGGADTITGDEGADTLHGGAGNDKLDGGTGNDTLNGDANDDELTGGSGNNTLDGGEGEDFAIFLGAMQVTADLDAGRAVVLHAAPEEGTGYLSFQAADSGTGHDTLTNIENVKGTHGKDRIDGDDNANTLKGLDEADIINGNDGGDTILPNRPAMADAMGNPVANVADTGATPDAEVDGVDVVDGGEGNDTISYEGEGTGVTVNLGTIVAAVGANTPDDATDDVIAHVAATVAAGSVDTATVVEIVDMIKVVPNEATEDEDDLVSTIENVTGGFGDDTLTGDARDNTLMGGGGADSLTGGAGNDIIDGGADTDTTLAGGDGDDTYMAFIAAETITEADTDGAGMMDTVHYATLRDDPATDGNDESIVNDTTPDNVEVAIGTPNVDTLTAAASGVTILGLGGNDTLTGAAGNDVLVGCAGEDTLVGGGGNNVFGIFNDDDDPDTITDFTTGTDDAVTDEIHLKGFDSGTPEPRLIPGNSTQAGVYMGTDLVAIVGSTAILAITNGDNPNTPETETDYNQSQAQSILDALGKDNAMGESIVRTVEFDSAKCM